MLIRRTHVQKLAESLLDRHGVTQAPIDVVSLAEKEGAHVVLVDDESDNSGFLYLEEGNGQKIIGVNKTQHEVRRRFTVAHELGHLLLHGHMSVHVDGVNAGFQVHHRDLNSGAGTDRFEVEANLFAAELLMPRRLLLQDLEGIDMLHVGDDEERIKALARKYKVSQLALSIRLSKLGYLQGMG